MDLRPVALGTSVTTYDPSRPTPAAIVSGEVAAHDAPHPLSVFDMFRIGIGPSSSHTVGPMRAGLAFTTELTTLKPPSHITIDLFGSLGATGRGHSTDRAVLLGLAGYDPETVDIETVESILPALASSNMLTLPSGTQVPLNIAEDVRFIPRTVLPYHVNALTITASDEDGAVILERTYYSVGGGFVMIQTNDDPHNPEVSSLATSQAGVGIDIPAPHPFASGVQLLAACDASGLSIAELVRSNEEAVRPRETVNAYLDRIADTMFDCVDAGTSAAGILPGGLDVPRRARALAGQLAERLTGPSSSSDEAGASSVLSGLLVRHRLEGSAQGVHQRRDERRALPDLVVGVEGAGAQRTPRLARAHHANGQTHIRAQGVIRDEGQGLVGVLGGLVLDLRRNDDALDRDRRTRHRFRPRQVSQDLLDIVVSQVLLDDRAQVVLGPVPARAQLLGDVGGQIRVGQQHRGRHQRVDGRGVIPAHTGRALLDIDNHVGQRDLARTRHHLNSHNPIISRRANKTETKKCMCAATLDRS